MRALKRMIPVAAFLVLAGGSATPASADWLLTPYFGVTFGGSADFDAGQIEDEFERKVAYGISAAWMGGGIAGFAIDFGTTPNFFETTAGPGDFEWGDNNVTTLMANLVLGVPVGGERGPGVRPYAAAGLGLMRSRTSIPGLFDDLSTNELGFNVGAGAHVFFNDTVGLNGDVRYFRGLTGDDSGDAPFELRARDLNYWRGTLGLTLRFGQ